ncbi:hypothetical protein WN51_13308 [Melipona quadrifasciata]|uniref:Uncharacterized protein n=1 Tax=Melipona quadrifasciata TaxID=166423 RepID=A0A0M9A1H5_9HYME|nr:hypothetical protein WN51_13308 [Melipona quadrifasciata]
MLDVSLHIEDKRAIRGPLCTLNKCITKYRVTLETSYTIGQKHPQHAKLKLKKADIDPIGKPYGAGQRLLRAKDEIDGTISKTHRVTVFSENERPMADRNGRSDSKDLAQCESSA